MSIVIEKSDFYTKSCCLLLFIIITCCFSVSSYSAECAACDKPLVNNCICPSGTSESVEGYCRAPNQLHINKGRGLDYDGDCTEDGGGLLGASSLDCDPYNPAIGPNVTEVCDEVDNNCDGNIDEGVTTTFYADLDGDGYGDPNTSTEACSLTTGYSSDSSDCNDADPSIFPGNIEVCDGVDNNCDGSIDEGLTSTFYADNDGDGYGDPNNTIEACSQPDNYRTDNTDCNDNDLNIYPGVTEICGDGLDNNCDGQIDENCPVCGNGVVETGEDCDDGNTVDGDGCSSTCVTETPAVGTITSAITGRVWMDRNLGASRSAISSSDEFAYGDLYQWGRGSDGHQLRNSATFGYQIYGIYNFPPYFIIGAYLDWYTPSISATWESTSYMQDPCPTSFRIPTTAEFLAEIPPGSGTLATFASGGLKFTFTGLRRGDSGHINNADVNGYYWVRDPDAFLRAEFGSIIQIRATEVYSQPMLKIFGLAIRCIRE